MNIKLHLLASAIVLPIVYSSASAQVCGNGVFLGQLSSNPYLADSTANKFCSFVPPLFTYKFNQSLHPLWSDFFL